MKGVNKAIILGNVGKDPEIRYTAAGHAVANFTVATSEQWKDKHTGEKKEATEWHRCSAFGKLAEIIEKYIKKGSKVYIEGQIRTRKWQDQSGQDRYTTEINVRDLQMLDSRPSGGQQQAPQQSPQQSQNDFDSDVPFDHPYRVTWRMV